MNPKEFVLNNTYSAQLLNFAGHSLYTKYVTFQTKYVTFQTKYVSFQTKYVSFQIRYVTFLNSN